MKIELSSFDTWKRSWFWVKISPKTRFFAKNDFSFQFRARAARQGGFAPLKSPDWGQSPQTPTIFIAFLDASWCPESCAKKWARYLKRFKSCIVSKFLSWFWSALYLLVNTFFHSWKLVDEKPKHYHKWFFLKYLEIL